VSTTDTGTDMRSAQASAKVSAANTDTGMHSAQASAEVSAANTGTDVHSAQAPAEVSPTNTAAQVSGPDASSKVTSANAASATTCKGVGCQCGASQRHGDDGDREPLHNRVLHDRYLSVPDGLGQSHPGLSLLRSSDAVSKHLCTFANGAYPILWQLASPCRDYPEPANSACGACGQEPVASDLRHPGWEIARHVGTSLSGVTTYSAPIARKNPELHFKSESSGESQLNQGIGLFKPIRHSNQRP
jgi:hypothetical protein